MPNKDDRFPTDEDIFQKTLEAAAADESAEEPEAGDEAAKDAESQKILLEALSKRGLATDGYSSDDELLEDLIEQLASSRESQTKEEPADDPLMREYAARREDFQKWLESRQQAQETPEGQPQQQQEEAKWRAPQLSETAQTMLDRGLVGRDEAGKLGVYNSVSGKYEYEPRYAAELRQIEDYVNWQTTAQRRLLTDPLGTLKEAGLFDEIKKAIDEAKKSISEEIKTETMTMAERKRIEEYAEAHRNEYYELDENGEIKTQIVDGRRVPVPNQKGIAYTQMYEKLVSEGVPEAKAHWLAVDAASLVSDNGKAEKKQPEAKDRRKAFLESARKAKSEASRSLPETAAKESAEFATDFDLWRAAMEEAKAEL